MMEKREKTRVNAAVDTPVVSVYCLTYNHEKTIAQAIESVLAQKTEFPFELIVHDDASTDQTPRIVMDYARRYPHIIRPILQRENQFHNGNLYKRFLDPIARGSYAAICEGDDYWCDPHKLQAQVELMKRHPGATMCFHAVHQLAADGSMINCRPLKENGVVPAEVIIKRGGMFCPTVSLMIRRDVMQCWPAFREMAQVYDYPLQMLAATMGEVWYLDTMMGVYRFASAGSWTEQHTGTTDLQYLENETAWMSLFNEYTGDRYTAAVDYHMAHLWFTEYRKATDPVIGQKAAGYIRRLKGKERLLFSGMMLIFRMLGTRANRLFYMLKKRMLK